VKSDEETTDIWAEWTEPAELRPELQDCIVEMRTFGAFIKHPYVNDIYMPQFHARYNKQYEYKLQACAEAMANGKWHSYIFLHERPWRYEALQAIADRMSAEEYWEAVVDVWMDSENIREHQEEWDELLRDRRPGHEHMMDDEERTALAAMPEEIMIYQGHTDERDDGWSWTIDRKKAEWFGRRFASMEQAEPRMTVAMAKRDDVLAYLTGRGESEILIDPDLVVVIAEHVLD
jgi:hypothetical protein